VDHEAQAAPESSLSYDEAKDICLDALVLVKKRQGAEYVPNFVGRSDVYGVNRHGELLVKHRVPLTSCTKTSIIYWPSTSSEASCA
jgi:hypothetical protein